MYKCTCINIIRVSALSATNSGFTTPAEDDVRRHKYLSLNHKLVKKRLAALKNAGLWEDSQDFQNHTLNSGTFLVAILPPSYLCK